jgi:hypothetical protein
MNTCPFLSLLFSLAMHSPRIIRMTIVTTVPLPYSFYLLSSLKHDTIATVLAATNTPMLHG